MTAIADLADRIGEDCVLITRPGVMDGYARRDPNLVAADIPIGACSMIGCYPEEGLLHTPL